MKFILPKPKRPKAKRSRRKKLHTYEQSQLEEIRTLIFQALGKTIDIEVTDA